MPLLWDVMLSIVSGFLFSSFQPMLKYGKFHKNVNDVWFFALGLIFNQIVDAGISVWCWVSGLQDWLMLYWIVPSTIGDAVYFIYALFPLFFVASYELNRVLYRKNMNHYLLFAVTTAWVIFTLIVWPDFVTLRKWTVNGITYPDQYLWNVTSFPPGNAAWFLPMNDGMFFQSFFFIVVFFLISFEAVAIISAVKNFYKPRMEGGAA
ncbi:MAG TPA: hypothetical protein VKM55_29470 [Candidatus Lokiarchaeia archaeon]|nr:hypothetical protein [Candidatus Lokiarchaeia archaeon]